MSKKIIYLLVLIILIIAVCLVIFLPKHSKKVLSAPASKVTENISCSALGQPTKVVDQTSPPVSDLSSCCGDLVPIFPTSDFNSTCVNTYLKAGLTGPTNYLCLACGDGICDVKYENNCNCPEDCDNQ